MQNLINPSCVVWFCFLLHFPLNLIKFMKSYFVTAENKISQSCPSVLCVCLHACVILWGCVFWFCDYLAKTVLLAKWAVCGELWWPEVRTESHCICSWMSVMLRAAVAGRSAWEPPEGGMLSCFNLCQCPSVWRWWEFRAQCVPLQLTIDPADRSCRQPSKASAFLFVCVWGLISVMSIPFCPISVAPLEGRLAGQPPLYCRSPANRECSCHFASVYAVWV